MGSASCQPLNAASWSGLSANFKKRTIVPHLNFDEGIRSTSISRQRRVGEAVASDYLRDLGKGENLPMPWFVGRARRAYVWTACHAIGKGECDRARIEQGEWKDNRCRARSVPSVGHVAKEEIDGAGEGCFADLSGAFRYEPIFRLRKS
ncbi:hypothetical protein [Rhizobium lusitanum]|uniref:hypothetical protein n=1 Tax=Rhizobium lusitanum TaxID=293958 RepID=UPI00114CF936|nr:hypothetical protein [Rhizobium lusitanum]